MENFFAIFKKLVDTHKEIINTKIETTDDGDSFLEMVFKNENSATLNLSSIYEKLKGSGIDDTDLESRASEFITDLFKTMNFKNKKMSLDSYYIELRPQNQSAITDLQEKLGGDTIQHMQFAVPLVWSLATDTLASPITSRTYHQFGFSDHDSFMNKVTDKYHKELSKLKIVIAHNELKIKLDDFVIDAYVLYSQQSRLTELMAGPLFYKITDKIMQTKPKETLYLLPVNRKMVIISKNAELSLKKIEKMVLMLFLTGIIDDNYSTHEDDIFIMQSALAELRITDNVINISNRYKSMGIKNIELISVDAVFEMNLQTSSNMMFGMGSVRPKPK